MEPFSYSEKLKGQPLIDYYSYLIELLLHAYKSECKLRTM